MIEAKPETLIGDRAYDRDPLNHELREDGIEMVAPRRSNRRRLDALRATLEQIGAVSTRLEEQYNRTKALAEFRS
jgi:RPA family protein